MKNKLGRLEKNILERLLENGYEAMIVGGAVRDYLIGKDFNDIDIATNAPYEKLVEIMGDLGELKFVGSLFGVLLVGGVEVATYRKEVYEDNNLLELELVVSNAYEDSTRRDFTVNAFYFDYSIDKIWDFHNSSLDIRNKVIRTVGDPFKRFNEDYSRILRAMYLSASLEFDIEVNTANAILELGYKVKEVPKALVGKIVQKAIKDGCFSEFLYNLKEYCLLEYIFPEMCHTIGLEQNPEYHSLDVWNHTLKVVEEAEKLRKGDVSFVMGAFLHDVAKGLEDVRGINKYGKPSDLGHEEKGVPIARKICKRLELGKDIANEVSMYVRWHGERMSNKKKSVKHFLFKFKNEFKSIDELKEGFDKLMDFMYCDAKGFNAWFGQDMLCKIYKNREIAKLIFEEHVFYSSQFEFNASVIAKHPKVKQNEIKTWIEFFIRQNIIEEDAVLKILDKQVEK